MTKPQEDQSQNPSHDPSKPKDSPSSASYYLTPSEIESLRESGRKICEQAKGRFLHLKPKAK